MRRLMSCLLLGLSLPVAQAVRLFDAPTHLRFSPREVSEAAREARPLAAAPLLACEAACERVQQVWQRLLPVAREQPHPALQLRLVITADGRSAHAHADGTVVFPLQLVAELGLADEEIAFILAHEIVHVLLEHEREVLTAVDALLRPDVRRTAEDLYGALQYDLGLSLKTGFLMQAAELEADRYGLQLAALAGFDPDRQAAALRKLLPSGASARAMLATHPSDQERLRHIEQARPSARSLLHPAR